MYRFTRQVLRFCLYLLHFILQTLEVAFQQIINFSSRILRIRSESIDLTGHQISEACIDYRMHCSIPLNHFFDFSFEKTVFAVISFLLFYSSQLSTCPSLPFPFFSCVFLLSLSYLYLSIFTITNTSSLAFPCQKSRLWEFTIGRSQNV